MKKRKKKVDLVWVKSADGTVFNKNTEVVSSRDDFKPFNFNFNFFQKTIGVRFRKKKKKN